MTIIKSKVVVVVEDEGIQREETVLSLQLAGMAAFGVPDGQTLDQLMRVHTVDVVVLDVGLPGESGLDIAARLSGLPSPVGLVMLTGKSTMVDKLAGLARGADAYLAKPADPRELIATIEAVRRRMNAAQAASELADVNLRAVAVVWQIAFDGRQLSAGVHGQVVKLSELQRLLLLCFKDLPLGQPVSRDKLMAALGYTDADSDPHRLETLVSRLRQKVRSKLSQDLPLQAIPRQGYAMAREVLFAY